VADVADGDGEEDRDVPGEPEDGAVDAQTAARGQRRLWRGRRTPGEADGRRADGRDTGGGLRTRGRRPTDKVDDARRTAATLTTGRTAASPAAGCGRRSADEANGAQTVADKAQTTTDDGRGGADSAQRTRQSAQMAADEAGEGKGGPRRRESRDGGQEEGRDDDRKKT
jgi:hypothetical protein